MNNLNCLSHWFPRIQAAGLPVPKTHIIRQEGGTVEALDGKGDFSALFQAIGAAAQQVGYPCFLRTGQGSGKHDWKHTCFLTSEKDIPQHVCNLTEWSCCVDFFGLPTDVWVVRELLPTIPQFTAFHGEMPICREFRFFVRSCEILCWHPYWPKFALEQGFPRKSSEFSVFDEDAERAFPDRWEERCAELCYLPATSEQEVFQLARAAGKAVDGEWSVDILETERGWFITDMAVASMSYHWPECSRATRPEEVPIE